MLDTISVFDAIETENTEHRVTSRRALALAHNRVESSLGRFLRAAQNEQEFFERLGLVEEDFDGYVTTASAEVGHSHPEHINAALRDHYRIAADKVEFVQTPAEEVEEEEKKNSGAVPPTHASISPEQAEKALERMSSAGRTWAVEGEQSLPLAKEAQGEAFVPSLGAPSIDQTQVADTLGQNSKGQYPILPGDEAHHTCPQCGSVNHDTDPTTGNPMCLDCGYSGPPANPHGSKLAFPYQDSMEPESGPTEESAFDAGFGNHTCTHCGQPYDAHDMHGACPVDQGYGGPSTDALGLDWHQQQGQHEYHNQRGHMASNEHDLVTCPACGGQPNSVGGKCSKCRNAGKVPNFGDSMVDVVGADIKTAAPLPYPTPEQDPLTDAQGWDIDGPAFADAQGVMHGPRDHGYDNPIRGEDGYIRPDIKSPYKDIARDEGYEQIPYVVDPNQQGLSQRDYGNEQGLQIAPNLPPVNAPPNAVRQGKQAGDGNTDLDGPEPKMDKRLWMPTSPGKPEYQDGPRHPTKEKDVTEIIGPMTNEGDLEEIDGQDSFHKNETLPTEKSDKPFADNNMEMAPHTKTFGDKGQTDPVTNQALSSADDVHKGNPLVNLLESEWPSDVAVKAAFLAA